MKRRQQKSNLNKRVSESGNSEIGIFPNSFPRFQTEALKQQKQEREMPDYMAASQLIHSIKPRNSFLSSSSRSQNEFKLNLINLLN